MKTYRLYYLIDGVWQSLYNELYARSRKEAKREFEDRHCLLLDGGGWKIVQE